MEDDKKIQRLSLDLPLEYHKRIKAQCALKNISMKKYVMRAIMEQILKDEQYST